MTMYIIILNANKQYKHVLQYNNRNGLASFKFGSVASFLTLSLLERNFPEGLGGGVFVKLWKIRRDGGL